MLDKDELWKVVENLLGNIQPVGETNADNLAYERMQVAEFLLDKLMDELMDVLPNYGRPEYSMNKAGRDVCNYLKELYDWLWYHIKDWKAIT